MVEPEIEVVWIRKDGKSITPNIKWMREFLIREAEISELIFDDSLDSEYKEELELDHLKSLEEDLKVFCDSKLSLLREHIKSGHRVLEPLKLQEDILDDLEDYTNLAFILLRYKGIVIAGICFYWDPLETIRIVGLDSVKILKMGEFIGITKYTVAKLVESCSPLKFKVVDYLIPFILNLGKSLDFDVVQVLPLPYMSELLRKRFNFIPMRDLSLDNVYQHLIHLNGDVSMDIINRRYLGRLIPK